MSATGSKLFNLAELKQQGGLKAGEILAVDSDLFSKFLIHLGRSVKRDKITKNMVFNTGVSAYTKDPINLFLKGESCIGKTYVTTQTLKYFPEKDVWMLGGLSPKALIHRYGVFVDENGVEIDFDEKPTKQSVKQKLIDDAAELAAIGQKLPKMDKKLIEKYFKEESKEWKERIRNGRYIIDLTNKILVFLEAPSFDTFMVLRPILSHDQEEISFQFTDKTSSGSLRTKNVVIKGWPATIFCTTVEKYIKDLTTRGFTVTPETIEEKYKDANILTGEKSALPWRFKEDFDFMLLQGYIGWLKNRLKTLGVVVPYGRELGACFPSIYARSMRDFKHFMALVRIRALFHCMQRPVLIDGENAYVIATQDDYEYILDLWREVEETTLTGLPGHITDFFHRAVEPLSESMDSFSYEELTVKYNEQTEEKRSSDTIRKWVKPLCDVGWLTKEKDADDKRKVVIRVIKNPKNSGEYRIPPFREFFNEERLRTWFDDAKKISAHNTFLPKENFLAEEPASLKGIQEKFYLHESGLRSDIFQGGSKPETTVKPEKETEDVGFRQSPTIPESLAIQENLDLLRSAWRKGPYNEFDSLLMETRGCSKEEAERLREKWLDEGLLAYSPEGWLVWVQGGS